MKKHLLVVLVLLNLAIAAQSPYSILYPGQVDSSTVKSMRYGDRLFTVYHNKDHEIVIKKVNSYGIPVGSAVISGFTLNPVSALYIFPHSSSQMMICGGTRTVIPPGTQATIPFIIRFDTSTLGNITIYKLGLPYNKIVINDIIDLPGGNILIGGTGTNNGSNYYGIMAHINAANGNVIQSFTVGTSVTSVTRISNNTIVLCGVNSGTPYIARTGLNTLGNFYSLRIPSLTAEKLASRPGGKYFFYYNNTNVFQLDTNLFSASYNGISQPAALSVCDYDNCIYRFSAGDKFEVIDSTLNQSMIRSFSSIPQFTNSPSVYYDKEFKNYYLGFAGAGSGTLTNYVVCRLDASGSNSCAVTGTNSSAFASITGASLAPLSTLTLPYSFSVATPPGQIASLSFTFLCTDVTGVDEKKGTGTEAIKMAYDGSAYTFWCQDQAENFELYNLAGKLLEKQDVAATVFSVDLKNQPPGIYLITIQQGNGRKQRLKLLHYQP